MNKPVLEKTKPVADSLAAAFTAQKTTFLNPVKTAVQAAQKSLLGLQQKDGHWVFELEADATIPAEYILLEHYLDRIDQPRAEKMGHYLRRIQGAHGGWPLYHDGEFNLSASVKAYFALKALGDSPDAPHMRRAREAILAHGGAERTNVFTRIQLALYGEIPWRGVPVMPVELMLLPGSAFFSLWNMSYWSRTVIAPLLVLGALKPKALNPRKVSVQELFRRPPEEIRDWIRGPYRSFWGRIFSWLDFVLRPVVPHFPRTLHKKALRKAVEFVEKRLSAGGLGAIYPAMANVVMMYRALGVPDNAPQAAQAWQALQDLLVERGEEIYCQPCVSPVWDTGLAGLAALEAASGPDGALPKETQRELKKSARWLRERQILDVRGDWAVNTAPDLLPGGWAFQYENDYYPDVDDTAVVGMFLHRFNPQENAQAVERARQWIIGMQSANGGWGAFDVDNNLQALNHIPFADHGALLDPPTADVSARCISFLAQLKNPEDARVIERGLSCLAREQEKDGSWFGRWGTNYIYGTWSVLCALNAAAVSPTDPMVEKAVKWLKQVQREDGGWGEDCASYEGAPGGKYKKSLPTQTAWACLGLMAAGEVESPEVARGIEYLLRHQNEQGNWSEEAYNAVGFPRVFYLRYHGYRHFFPLMALARYRNLRAAGTTRVAFGF